MTKKMNGTVALALVALALSAGAAFADETSTTSVQAVAPKLTDKLILSYTGYLYGPNFGKMDGRTTDANFGVEENGGKVVNLDSNFKLGYKLSSDVSLSGTFRYISQETVGKGGTLKDSWLALSHGHAIQRGNFNSAFELRAYLPISDASQAANKITAFRFNQNSNFTFGDLTAGVYSYIRYDVVGNTGGAGTQQLYLYAAPNAAYQLSKTVAATMWIDLAQYEKDIKTANNSIYYDGGVDIEPGVSWDITPNINVNPYINFFPGNARADSTTINMIISAKVL